MSPPQRVSVVGTTGSGKTSFAARLASALGIPHVELDAIHWGPGWTPLEDGPFQELTRAATAGPAWVVDGNYAVVRDIVWEQADTVVWLNFSFPVMFWRLLRRTTRRILSRKPIWNDNRESLRTTLSRESLFVWQVNTYRRRRAEYPERFADPRWSHIRVVTLRSPREADAWLAGIAASAAGARRHD